MSIDIGRNMGDGFLPGNPTVEGILSRISTSGELPDAPPTQSQKEREALLEAYVWLNNSEKGRRILNDLLDKSLRLGVISAGTPQTIEAVALAAAKRQGRCDIVCGILSSIRAGLDMKAKKAKAKKSK